MTLTETATATKRFLRVFLIFGGAFLILWIAYLYIYNNIYIPYKKSQIKAEQRFGALPKPKFPQTLISSASIDYSLDTPTGGLPADPTRLLNVYFIPPVETSFLSPDRAKKLATTLGFPAGPDILSATKYKFNDNRGGNITINLDSGNFEFSRQPENTTPDLTALPGQDQLGTEFKGYLTAAGLSKPDTDSGPYKVIYNPPDRKDANTATVSIWQANIETNFPIVTANPDQSLIWATVTKYSAPTSHFTTLNYTYWNVDKETLSTYFSKPVAQAFAELKQGKGVVVKNQSPGAKASISKVYIGYFMSQEYNSFLTPVFVFEGEKFTAYVPALADASYAQ
jgi:hypothetical protein